MPELITNALGMPGLGWLVLSICVAGVVRGFSGFGTALIFVPVAGQFLPTADVILVMTVTGMVSIITLVPGAWKIAERSEVARLALPAVIAAPLGIWLMTQVDALTVRWLVTGIAAATLLALTTGWRYRARVETPGLVTIGGAAGVVGGMTGLTGPMVILFYLAGARAANIIRANTILFLAALDIGIAATLIASGLSTSEPLVLALILAVPYLGATLIGQRLFRPQFDLLYRWLAYAVIFLAVLTGLPVFD